MSFKRLLVPSILLVAASFLLAPLPARAQTGGVMFVTSANPKGNAIITGKGSRVIEVRHSIVSPRDPQSGLPTGKRQNVSPRDPQSGLATGKRQWKPFTIVKEVDSASPKLFQALKQNEVLNVKIEFSAGGKAPRTIELQGATIANLHTVRQGVEEIEFRYEKIVVTHQNGQKSYSDDWTL
jgi:type VI secretion system secreted protein Hcp